MSGIKVTLFGTPRVLHTRTQQSPDPSGDTEGKLEVVTIPRRKSVALLAYLATDPRHHHRQTLALLLWPDADPLASASYLRRDLAILNKALGPNHLIIDRESVMMSQHADTDFDVRRFRSLLQASNQHGHRSNEICHDCIALLEDAVSLYRGDFMEGFSLSDSAAFDEWQRSEAENLRSEALSSIIKLTRAFGNLRDFAKAIDYARRWTALAPDDESAHRELMYLYANVGNPAAAIQQYRNCTRILEEEFGQAPQDMTTQLLVAIQSGGRLAAPTLMTVLPNYLNVANKTELAVGWSYTDDSLAGQAATQGNLSAATDIFVARNEELAELTRLLVDTPRCRLLTVMGPGGIGKTRLAIRAAKLSASSFNDGAYLVSLSGMTSGEQLTLGIASALSVRPIMDPESYLQNYLRSRNLLLVLDGIEHLLQSPQGSESAPSTAQSLILDILTAAPEVKILVTSSERLNLQEEWVSEIRGLTYPDIKESHELIRMPSNQWDLEKYGSVELFVASAQKVQPSFELNQSNIAAVLRICQTLEGLPLGLELAASWIRSMSCQEIAQQLEEKSDLPSSLLRNVPERHRSLQTLFERSWQLLEEDERIVASKLAVFNGSFQRAAAEMIAGADLTSLVSLRDKSVLYFTDRDRHSMHSTLRNFALTRLAATPDIYQQTSDRHSDFYLAHLQSLPLHPLRAVVPDKLPPILAELGNISTAWRWALAQDKVAAVERYFESLHLVYYFSGLQREGYEAFGNAYERLTIEGANQTLTAEREFLLGQLLSRQARFAYRLGLHAEARQKFQASLAMVEKPAMDRLPGAEQARGFCYYYLGAVARVFAEYETATTLCRKSLEIFQNCEDLWGKAAAQKLLGMIAASQSDLAEAKQHLLKALEMYRGAHNQDGIANTLNDLGVLADRSGQPQEAKRLYQQCLTIYRQLGDNWGTAVALNNLGYLASTQGEYKDALRLLEESLSIQRTIGARLQIANALSNLGSVTRELNEYESARRYFHEALRLAQEVESIPLALELLVGIAALFVSQHPQETAGPAMRLGLALQHPLTDEMTRAAAIRYLKEIDGELAASIKMAAEDQSDYSHLNSVLEEVVAETILQLAN